MCVKNHKFKEAGIPVVYARCDNKIEDVSLGKQSGNSYWKLGIKFDCTSRDTPHQNHMSELGFKTIFNQGRDIMNASNIPIKL